MSQELIDNLTDVHSRVYSWVEKHHKHKYNRMQKNICISAFQRDLLNSNLELNRQAIILKIVSDICYTFKG